MNLWPSVCLSHTCTICIPLSRNSRTRMKEKPYRCSECCLGFARTPFWEDSRQYPYEKRLQVVEIQRLPANVSVCREQSFVNHVTTIILTGVPRISESRQVCLSSVGRNIMETRLSLWNNATYIPEFRARIFAPIRSYGMPFALGLQGSPRIRPLRGGPMAA